MMNCIKSIKLREYTALTLIMAIVMLMMPNVGVVTTQAAQGAAISVSMSQRKIVWDPNQKIKIMCIGDSITQMDACYWRPFLSDDLINAGYNVQFVGRQHDQYRCLQPNSEGYNGATTDNIISILSDALAANMPDIAMVHIGTNDLSGAHPDDTLRKLKIIIQRLQAAKPDMVIVLSEIILNKTYGCEWMYDYNIPRIALELTTETSPVVVVDQYSGGTYDILFGGQPGPHPNAAGGRWMANNYWPVMTSLLEGRIPEPMPASNWIQGPAGYTLCSFARNGDDSVNFENAIVDVAYGMPGTNNWAYRSGVTGTISFRSLTNAFDGYGFYKLVSGTLPATIPQPNPVFTTPPPPAADYPPRPTPSPVVEPTHAPGTPYVNELPPMDGITNMVIDDMFGNYRIPGWDVQGGEFDGRNKQLVNGMLHLFNPGGRNVAGDGTFYRQLPYAINSGKYVVQTEFKFTNPVVGTSIQRFLAVADQIDTNAAIDAINFGFAANGGRMSYSSNSSQINMPIYLTTNTKYGLRVIMDFNSKTQSTYIYQLSPTADPQELFRVENVPFYNNTITNANYLIFKMGQGNDFYLDNTMLYQYPDGSTPPPVTPTPIPTPTATPNGDSANWVKLAPLYTSPSYYVNDTFTGADGTLIKNTAIAAEWAGCETHNGTDKIFDIQNNMMHIKVGNGTDMYGTTLTRDTGTTISSGTVVTQFETKWTSLSASNPDFPSLIDPTGTYKSAKVVTSSNGGINYYNNGNQWMGKAFSLNTIYGIRVITNLDSKTYSVYVYDLTAHPNADVLYVSQENIPFVNSSASSIYKVLFGLNRVNNDDELYIDNLMVYPGQTTSTPTPTPTMTPTPTPTATPAPTTSPGVTYIVNEDFPPTSSGWTLNTDYVQNGQLILNEGKTAKDAFADITGNNVVAEFKYTLGSDVPSQSWVLPLMEDSAAGSGNEAVQGMIYNNGFIFGGSAMNGVTASANTSYFVRVTMNFTTHTYDVFLKNLSNGSSSTLVGLAFKNAANNKINEAQFSIGGGNSTASLDYFRIYNGANGLTQVP